MIEILIAVAVVVAIGVITLITAPLVVRFMGVYTDKLSEEYTPLSVLEDTTKKQESTTNGR